MESLSSQIPDPPADVLFGGVAKVLQGLDVLENQVLWM
jgi:hypothetical protein